MSAQPETWPDFFIVGAPRAETTSLYEWLRGHPHIFMPPKKEPHFFTHIEPSREYRRLYWPVGTECEYLKGDLAPNLGTPMELSPHVSVALFYAVLVGGILRLWRKLPGAAEQPAAPGRKPGRRL